MTLNVDIEHLRQLLDYCQSFAMEMLKRKKAFYPFGAFINTERKLEAVGGHLGEEYPNPQELYRFLEGSFQAMSKEKKILACALAADVTIPEEYKSNFTDGIRVHIETKGYSRCIYTPYRHLPYRALRIFLGFLPLVEYKEEITVDVPQAMLGKKVSG